MDIFTPINEAVFEEINYQLKLEDRSKLVAHFESWLASNIKMGTPDSVVMPFKLELSRALMNCEMTVTGDTFSISSPGLDHVFKTVEFGSRWLAPHPNFVLEAARVVFGEELP